MTKEKAKLLIEEVIDDYWEDDGYGNTTQHYDDVTDALYMAIGALEQEPSEDCVSRQSVIDGINEYFHDEYYQRTSIQDGRDCLIEDVIKDLPSVTPTQRWIPLVRREPTEEEKAYYKETHGEELGYMIDSKMPSNGQEVLVSVGNSVSQDTFFEEFYNFEGWDISDVDAWMPLPKPYKTESEDKE